MRVISSVAIALLAFSSAVVAAPATKSHDVVHAPGGSSLYGITYNALDANGQCKTQSAITKDVKKYKSNGIINIRTYAQQCNQLDLILNAIKSAGGGMTVLTAVWIDGNNSNYLTEVKTLTHTLSSNKLSSSYISGVLVGNEVLFNKVISSSQLAAKIKDVKSKVKSHGLLVGTCEIPPSFTSAIISASDFLVANIHPYFGQVPATQAAQNLVLQFNNLKKNVKGKPLIVGETGWPTAGATYGQSVPSTHNLQTYINNIQCIDKSIKYFFFDSVDSPWKTPGVEQHWGVWKSNGASKGLKLKTTCPKK
ncbi:unnamed protein product [Umbelopsis ramanniana]